MSQSNIPEEWESESPVEAPDRWHGGRVEHTGGNIFCRVWRTVEDHTDADVDEYLEVGYNGDFAGVSVSRYVTDEDYGYVFEETVEDRQVSENTDVACAEMAVRLMKRYPSDEN
jgi:hypothetical protein